MYTGEGNRHQLKHRYRQSTGLDLMPVHQKLNHHHPDKRGGGDDSECNESRCSADRAGMTDSFYDSVHLNLLSFDITLSVVTKPDIITDLLPGSEKAYCY